MKYYIDTIKGLLITTRHLIANTLGREKAGVVTVEYPEQKLTYRPNYRGLHRLTTRPDGSPKCVACYMCETICPAYCIHIEAEESAVGKPDSASAGEFTSPERAGGSGGHGAPTRHVEKKPKVFTIDELRCVVCGLCVEACPEDAIRMDTGMHPPPGLTRAEFLYKRDVLMAHKGIGPATNPSGGGRRP